ncbi:unnamed protein product [Dicrocoelium dendriticum]|nr:unnamed protein product [Dicrocoelium dendriticum]
MNQLLCAFLIACRLLTIAAGENRAQAVFTECQELHSASSMGIIKNPEGFGQIDLCTYAIKINADSQIAMSFTETNMSVVAASYLDYVLVFDGLDCMSERIGVAYGTETPTYISNGNMMMAWYISESNSRIFKATYSAVNKDNTTTPNPPMGGNSILINCGEELNGTRGDFSFKANRNANHLCIWRLRVQNGNRIRLRVRAFLWSSRGSWLVILDGGNCDAKVLAFIDPWDPPYMYGAISTSNAVVVVFSSAFGSSPDSIQASYWEVETPTTASTSSTTTESNETTSTVRDDETTTFTGSSSNETTTTTSTPSTTTESTKTTSTMRDDETTTFTGSSSNGHKPQATLLLLGSCILSIMCFG